VGFSRTRIGAAAIHELLSPRREVSVAVMAVAITMMMVVGIYAEG